MNNFKLTELPVYEIKNLFTGKNEISQSKKMKSFVIANGRRCIDTIINKNGGTFQYVGGYFLRINPECIEHIHPYAKYVFIKLHTPVSITSLKYVNDYISLLWW